jgi:uncharacterized repeat protein (TIGR01451 family)
MMKTKHGFSEKIRQILLTIGIMGLAALLFLSSGQQRSWAAPGQSPNQQTVPNRPTPTPNPLQPPPPQPEPPPNPGNSGGGDSGGDRAQPAPNPVAENPQTQETAPLPAPGNPEAVPAEAPTGPEAEVATAPETDQAGPEAEQVPAGDDPLTETEAGAAAPERAVQAADLSLGLTVDSAKPQVGQPVTLVTVVRNDGPAPATKVLVRASLPAGLILDSATASQGHYSPGPGVWQIDTIAVGEEVTLSLVARVESRATKLNISEIMAVFQPDPDSVPNNGVPVEDDQAEVAIAGQADETALPANASAPAETGPTGAGTSPVPATELAGEAGGIPYWLFILLGGVILVGIGLVLVRRS